MASRTPGQSSTQQLLSDWQAKNPTAQDLHDKLNKINRRREMQILEAWFTSESEDSQSFSAKKNISNDDRTASQIQAALDNFDSKSFKPPGKGSMRKSSPPKLQDENVNLNRCDTFKEKREMGSKHLEGGLISKPSMKKQFSKESEGEDKTIMHEMGMSGAGKSFDNMAGASICQQNHKSLTSTMSNGPKSSDADLSMALNGIHGFSYKEIAQATDGFSDDCLIGQGAYGKVFKATLKNTKCAVKKLFPRDASGNIEGEVKRELATLSKYRHNNIVLLYGYMIDQPDVSMADVCLVYQFMPNGSLEDRLACRNNTPALTWQRRLGILRGAACGLQFIHTLTDTPLIHGDIKSGNILLDRNFEAKISDLGMAQHATSGSEGLLTHITKKQADTKQYQTRAYFPPEAQRGSKMSIKGDTYSFGVVIYEVCTGETAFDEKREGADTKFLVDFIQEMVGNNEEKFYSMCDSRDRNISQDLYNSVFTLAQSCTFRQKKGRPEMKIVFTELETLENDYLNSSSVADSPSIHSEQPMMSYPALTNQNYPIYIDSSSLDPHISSLLSQFPPGTQIPQSLLLQFEYDRILKIPEADMDLKTQQKLAEIKKYDDEFNKPDAKQWVEAGENNDEVVENNDEENTQGEISHEQNTDIPTQQESDETSNQVYQDDQPECPSEVDFETLRQERIRKRSEALSMQPQEEDPIVKEKFVKSRDDFFARFQQQVMESQYSDDNDFAGENEEEEDEYTLVNKTEEQHQEIRYLSDQIDDHCDSCQLFSQIDENDDPSCENVVPSCENVDDPSIENYNEVDNNDFGENLEMHRQKFDTYQIIAREMSDENGKVVGELVAHEQRPYEGEVTEDENSLSNDFGNSLSLETDGDVKFSNIDNNNVNILTNQLSQNNKFPWPLQRRPEASEGECYV